MSQESLTISRLMSGGLITNYFCSSSCRHCLYRCSPRWPKDYISVDTARANLETIRRLGCRAVHIGGGEPLLRPEGVAAVLEVAHQTGVSVEYVETNSSWYRDHDTACAILEGLAMRGLSTLLISISPFHNERIPFYKVRGVMAACRETGISVFPWVADFISDLSAFDEQRPHSLEEYQELFGQDYIKHLPRRYWIAPGGRALETFGRLSRKKPIAQLAAEGRPGCKELAGVSHFHLDLYGNYIPGLCAGLSIRREDLGSPLDANEYPIISRLYTGGIGEFVSYAAEAHGFKASEPAYGSKCELCYEVRRFLVVDKGLDSRELQPRGHYMYG
ncbi:MAG: radical SAM protein [Anaerolineae bacterium]